MIGLRADIGPGFAIMHPVGVVINSAVKAGNNLAVESGVVIGTISGQSPTLENNIYIGSGAKILGRVNIGSQVRIGANAVVVKDAKKGEVLVGIPAKPIKKTVLQ